MRNVLGILLNLVYIIASVIPKKRSLWLFSAWNGLKYSDNPRYVYNYLIKNRKDINAVWLTKDSKTLDRLKNIGLPVVYTYSVKGIIYQLSAGVVAYTHSVSWEFAGWAVGGRTKKIQLWHGMPIKKIGMDDKKNLKPALRVLLSSIFWPYRSDKFHLMIALSEIDKSIYVKAFEADQNLIMITGFPRNDFLLKSNIPCKSTSKVVQLLYMPTFRGEVNGCLDLIEPDFFAYSYINDWLVGHNCVLNIRLHPANRYSVRALNHIDNSSNINVCESDSDLHSILSDYDVYITDFSSIFFDLIITKKPILLAPIGIQEYLDKDREGFYFELCNIGVNKLYYDWDSLLYGLDKIIRMYRNDASFEYQSLNRFHKYTDDFSSKRVVSEIEKLMNNANN